MQSSKKRKHFAQSTASSKQVLSVNRRARYDYSISEVLVAGLRLTGTEIKSIRNRNLSLAEGYIQVNSGQAYLHGVYIAPYGPAGSQNHDTKRIRTLLLHRREIDHLMSKTNIQGFTAVPLQLFLSGRLAKLEIGIGKGRKRYDKRALIAKRDAERDMLRHLKGR